MHCTIHVNGRRYLLDDFVIFALLWGSRDYPLAASVIIGLGHHISRQTYIGSACLCFERCKCLIAFLGRSTYA